MIKVTSEIGRLRRVVVQPPGPALERVLPDHINPSSPDYVLFDDLVHVPLARREHEELRALLACTAEVLIFEDLAAEVLEIPAARAEVFDRLEKAHVVHDSVLRRLEEFDGEALAASLMVGTVGGGLTDPAFLPPLPNLIFTRDLAAVVGETLVVGKASKRARQRESLLVWTLVDHHPSFQNAKVAKVSRKMRERRAEPLTIEGGDVLVVSESLACIGSSERTSWSMIFHLADELLDSGMETVLVVEMPKQRSAMHLDTIFTLLDRDAGVVYPPIIDPLGGRTASVSALRRVGGSTVVEDSGLDLFETLAAHGHPLKRVLCGDGHPVHSHREQWTDGSNYFALGPGVVVGYACNVHTARAISAVGFRVIDPESFLEELARDFHDDFDELLQSGRKYAIHIDGSELSRGRGGPRCLTLPLLRDAP